MFFLPILLALLTPAHAQARYHAILMAHNDMSRVTNAEGENVLTSTGLMQLFLPAEPDKKSLVRPDPPPADAQPARSSSLGDSRSPPRCNPSRKSQLCYVGRDQRRVEDFLLLYADPSLVTRLDVHHAGPSLPATETSPQVRASTVEQAGLAFEETRCRIATLKGVEAEGCGHTPLTDGARILSGDDREDIVFVHFSGHGVPEGLVLRNGLLPPRQLEQWTESLGADLVVVIIDACHGGGLLSQQSFKGEEAEQVGPARVFAAPVFQRRPNNAPSGVAVFNSAVHPELQELQELGSGVLTHVVLSGLMGAADDDGDRKITFAELSAFFHANTTEAGEFEGHTASPGGRRERVLLDLDDARVASHIIELDRGLDGRMLLTDRGGAVAEVSLYGRALHTSRLVELHLPAPTHDLYFLDLADNEVPEVRALYAWDLTREARQFKTFSGDPAPTTSAYVDYLATTNAARRMFSPRIYPVAEWRPGLLLSLTGLVGYHRSEVYGRTEKEDMGTFKGHLIAQGWEDTHAETHLRALQAASPDYWNLIRTGLVLRAHGLWFGQAELRGEMGFAPRSMVHLIDGSPLFMARVGGGVGASSYLFSPGLLGSLTVGASVNYASVPDAGQSPMGGTFPSASPTSLVNPYLSGALRLQLPQVRPLVFEVTRLWDHHRIEALWAGAEPKGGMPAIAGDCDTPSACIEARQYKGYQVSVGFEIGRRSL